MKLVLLSGGSGKRLFPLSNDSRSKQYLKVIRDKYGERVSMYQHILGQLSDAGLSEDLVVTVSDSQEIYSNAQVVYPVHRVVQPSKRETFPAMMLCASYLSYELDCSDDEIVGFMPVDSYVDVDYYESFKKAEKLLRESELNICLVGALPNYPATGYGYVIPETSEEVSRVSTFKEKPTEDLAKQFIENGALWNCGVVIAKLGYLRRFLCDYFEEKDFNLIQ